jgi:hypothetical protein
MDNNVTTDLPPAAAPHVVCVLAEGNYFRGAAALTNSLARNGFAGHVVVGYRGALPRWEGPVTPRPGPAQLVAPGVDIQFLAVTGDWHLSNVKPHFLLRVLAELHPAPASLWYREVTGYFNGGCVGLASGQPAFLQAWKTLLDTYAADGADMSRMVNRSGKPEYAKMDQDLLNAAVMATDTPFCVLGQEAMDAFPSASIMSHAMVFAKPWVRNYIRDAIIGFQPDPAHKAFWFYADQPIQSFTLAEWRRKMLILRVTKLLGYFKRRTVRDW